jgi:hypothetical protein
MDNQRRHNRRDVHRKGSGVNMRARFITAGYLFASFLIGATAAFGQTANCRVTTAAPSYTDGTPAPLSCDTDGNLRTNAAPPATQDVNVVEVGGNAVTTTIPVSGTVTATGPLTDAELRATPVPVSGPLTDAQLRAAVVPTQDNANGATGAAVPARAGYQGNNVAGNLTGQIGCGATAIYDASTSGNTQLVALQSSQTIYVCGYSIMASGTVNVRLVTGTGTACATDEASVTPAWQLTAQAGLVDGSPIYRGMKSAVSSALCIETSGAVAVQAVVYYTQF